MSKTEQKFFSNNLVQCRVVRVICEFYRMEHLHRNVNAELVVLTELQYILWSN